MTIEVNMSNNVELTLNVKITSTKIGTLLSALQTAAEMKDAYAFQKEEYREIARELGIALTLSMQASDQAYQRVLDNASHVERRIAKAS
tara:strand:- start:916 stop:1182 length:267 start_codon:yes stop_codon:yes gene_type:complete